jgi:hypothetical protein
MVSNDAIFNPSKPLFDQSCLTHALSGACKKAVIDAQTETFSIEQTRTKLQKCITWTKKSKRVQFFETSTTRVLPSPPSKRLTPVKTRFAYLIYAFRRLVSNPAAINYLYGQKEGMSPELRKKLPSKEDWEVARFLVETMNDKWIKLITIRCYS